MTDCGQSGGDDGRIRYRLDYYGLPEHQAAQVAKLVDVIQVVDHGDHDGWTTIIFWGDEQLASVVHAHFDHSGNVYVRPEDAAGEADGRVVPFGRWRRAGRRDPGCGVCSGEIPW